MRDEAGAVDAAVTTPGAGCADGPPETGDLVVDGALRDLAAVPADHLDEALTAGDAVHTTLTSRLSDLGT